MNPVHWFLFIGTIVVSLGFTFYGLWVKGKYAMPNHPTALTGCEVARLVLDRMGVIHVSVTPVEPPHSPEDYLSSEGLFLEKKIYEGRDILSLVLAARQAFLKGQLSDITFWVHLKKRMAFVVSLAVTLGWLFQLTGIFLGGLSFFSNLGLGAFGVVMLIAVFDLPFELEVEEKTSQMLKEADSLAPYEFMSFKKVNQAVSFSGMTCLIQAPAHICGCFFKRNLPR
jgi:hypothetical protein